MSGRAPGACPDEGKVVDVGGGKSECLAWGQWTNCREVGYCVYEALKDDGSGEGHMTIFDYMEDEDEDDDR